MVRQPYRGNPEVKQYALYNNFSGGMNTSDVDEAVFTNQFRLLENVELIERGALQNRKGFGDFKLFNELLAAAGINYTFESVYMFLPILDTANIIDTINNNDTLENFFLNNYNAFKLALLSIGTVNNSLEIRVDKIEKDEGVNTVGLTTEKYQLGVVYDRPKRITSIEYINFNGKVIIPLGQLNSELEGFLEVSVEDEVEIIKETTKQWVRTTNYSEYDSSTTKRFPTGAYNTITQALTALEEQYPAESETQPTSTAARIELTSGLCVGSIGPAYTKSTCELNEGTWIPDFIYAKIVELESNTEIIHPDRIKFKKIDSSTNYYVPNAYEIANVGFNVLSQNPLNNIEPVFTSAKSIRTFWLTKINNKNTFNVEENFNTPIYKIPQNEDFALNVLVTGGVTPQELTVDVYTEDFEGNKVPVKPEGNDKIINTVVDDSIIRFRIRLNIERTETTFIEVKKVIQSDPTVKYEFANTTNMIEEFTTREHFYELSSDGRFAKINMKKGWRLDTSNPYKYGYEVPTLTGGITDTSSSKRWVELTGTDSFAYWYSLPEENRHEGDGNPPDVSDSKYKIGDAWLGYFDTYPTMRLFKVVQDPSETIPDTVLNKVVLSSSSATYPELNGTYQPYLAEDNGTKKVVDFIKIGTTTGEKFTSEIDDIKGITSTVRKYPTFGEIYKTLDDGKFWRWKGTEDGNIDDFEEYDPSEEDIVEFSFVNAFDIGQNMDLKPIKGIKTNNAKIIEHNSRLLIYDKNTMWFSDLYEFSYIPNNNYVVLPLRSDDEIVKIAYFRGSYIIFTKYSIYRMSGSFGMEDFSITLINDAIGCIARDSVRAINNTLVFLTVDGLYMLKQNFYMEGLENVEKIDTQVKGLFKPLSNWESISYNEQLLFLEKDKDNKYVRTVKQYYNIPVVKNVFPTTIDKYTGGIDNLFRLGINLVSYKSGTFYVYGSTYSDFMPKDVEEEDRKNYFYKVVIETPNYSLGLPTHDKKYKNVYIKTRTKKVSPLSLYVYVDGYEYINPAYYKATLNKFREIIYDLVSDVNITMRHARLAMNPSSDYAEYEVQYNEFGEITHVTVEVSEEEFLEPVYNVDDFVLGTDVLGDKEYQTHKLAVSGKGKTVSFRIEQLVDEEFSIQDIGILYKVGKVKEG